jgi:hypothetical protein
MAGGQVKLSYATAICILYAALLAAVITTSALLTGGRLFYSLDDPYIHLALAENILRGVYGVNLSEYSSPSSSILYPFILSVTQALKLGTLGPIVVDAAAGVVSVYLTCRYVERYCLKNRPNFPGNIFGYALGVLLIFCLSAIALPMTGLEHMIHVLLVVVVITGLADVLDGGEVTVSFGVATALMPLIRFEGAALSVAVILALWFLGRWRVALAIALAISLALCADVLFMAKLGLPLLPSSVLVKSPLAAAAVDAGGLQAVLAPVVGNLARSFSSSERIVLLLMLIGLPIGWRLSPPAERKRNGVMAAVAGAALFAHMVAGQYNAGHRYEVYANVIGILGLVYLFRTRLTRMVDDGQWLAQGLVLCALALVSVPYAYATIRTPVATRGIYDQQFQMHRFAADFYDKPVAVNDLGLVSYRNDNYVLDLWGLGSERARRLKSTNNFGERQIAQLVAQYRVGVVMIFEPWFDDAIPKEWRKVALLHSDGAIASCDGVSFFLTPSGDYAEVETALTRFKPTLPAGDRLDINGDFTPVTCKRNTATFGPSPRPH